MRILNEEEMWSAVTLEEVMEAVEDALAIHKSGNYLMPDRLAATRNGNTIMFMPCLMDTAIGTKMLCEFPDNPKKGLPLLTGLMILNDVKNGFPLAIMNGSCLTAMRTGAVGGVGIRYLAREDAASAALAGCGVQGLHQLLYACSVRPIKDIYLYDAFVKDLAPFVERLKGRLNRPEISVHICKTAKEAAASADILISATQTVDPIWPDDTELLRGKCFIAIGSWKPERRELPDAVWKLVKNVYIELPFACEESGDLGIPLTNGLLTMDRVKMMEDLISDRKAGNVPEMGETRCFKSVGMGIYDARVAQLIYEKALEKGVGQQVKW
ncbi:MAG: ornithine cyclodeaminase family protein [Clostridium sp.]|nr:ornithine cyclodeaminase family protein [Clostridium sp.]